MTDLNLYIDNERNIYDTKINAFKKLWKDYNKKGSVSDAKAKRLFKPAIREAINHAKKFDESVSKQDIRDAENEMLREFKTEVIELRNFDWAK